MELNKINHAVEMTARCQSVSFVHQTNQWHADLWCNAIGEMVTGYGTPAWCAVQAAHALHFHHSNN